MISVGWSSSPGVALVEEGGTGERPPLPAGGTVACCCVGGGAAGEGAAAPAGAGRAGTGVGAPEGVLCACAASAAGADVAAPPVGAAAGIAAVAGASLGAAAAGAAPIGKSTLRLKGSPQLGQKRSSPLWIAAQRGHAVMPASRRTVTGWRSERFASSARSSASIRLSVLSFASTSSSLR